MRSFKHQLKLLILQLNLPDKPLLMLKKLLMHGELDSLQVLLPSVKSEKSLMLKLFTLTTLRHQSRLPITLLNLPDNKQLTLKKMLMPGEQDGLQVLVQFFHWLKVLEINHMLSISINLLIQ
jgi:hypothetical protein